MSSPAAAFPDRACLTIDLDALAHNRTVLVTVAAGAEVAAVVKADGYGLGAGPIARRLYAEGTRSFFVARLAEGEALRDALPAPDAAIYVLDGMPSGASRRLAARRLIPVICTADQARAALDFQGPLALQVDTGMKRQGLTFEDARAMAGRLDVALVMSHLGSAADPHETRNREQLARFREVRALFPRARASLAASAGAFLGPEYRYDMIRAGISLYGGGPEERPDPRLRAVATLTAPILDIRELTGGDRVGYGVSFTAPRAMRVATVAAGYADGVMRSAMGKGHAWAAGGHRRLLAVTMDLLVVELPEGGRIGDPVELLGPHVLLDDLAAAAGTVAHEVLVRLSARADRIYLGA